MNSESGESLDGFRRLDKVLHLLARYSSNPAKLRVKLQENAHSLIDHNLQIKLGSGKYQWMGKALLAMRASNDMNSE